jgi:glycosyltransferase involved in cell wall biosynthesis
MKIIYFHQYFKTRDGSGPIRSYEMAKYFVDQGHQVTMVYGLSENTHSTLTGPYIRGKRRGTVDGIECIEFDLHYSNKLNFIQRSLVFISYSFKSISILFKEEFDLVFATSTPLTAGIPGICMKLLGKTKPFVFEVRDLWPELPREMGVIKNKVVLWAMGLLEWLSYNTADACVALSPGIREGIRAKLKDKEKSVYLVPNGSDLDFFVPGKASKSNIPGAKESDFVAIFTGTHGIANGLDAALDAAKVLIQKGYKDVIKLVFVGDGMKKEGLVNRARNEGLSNCVFVEQVTKKELLKLLHAADVGLMLLANVRAFYYGTSPNKFFDYISLGLPVLNNYPGWLADMIQENECGLVVPPDDPEAFADALIQMYKEPTALATMGRNGRLLAEQTFDRQYLAKQLLHALEKEVTKYQPYPKQDVKIPV